jgi:hypothetical protein
VDPRRSPQRIGDAHLADELAYLRWYSWSATTAPRLPAPIRSEAGPTNAVQIRLRASLIGQKDCVILPQLSARLGLRQGHPRLVVNSAAQVTGVPPVQIDTRCSCYSPRTIQGRVDLGH